MNRTLARTKLFAIFIIIAVLSGMIVGFPGSIRQPGAGPSQSVIVQGTSINQAATAVLKYGGTVTSRLEIINGVAATLPFEALVNLRAENGIRGVYPNAETLASNLPFTPAYKVSGGDPATDYANVTGADLVWQEGVTGKGVTVALLDTGVAWDPFLQKGVDGKKRSLLGWVDFISGKNKPFDPNGHGTHIAGIIANAAAGQDGEYNGIAPGADLVSVRVLDENGAGTYESVIRGIQWVIENKDQYNIKVLNLSLHALVQSPYWADPLNQAVMQAWAQGITVVVASGNEGPGPLTVSVPGNIPYVITVGAFTDNYTPADWSDDYLAPFSSAGPTLDNFVKPDLVAPGAHMVSTMLPSSVISKNHEAFRISSQYFSMAGTSQSAAVVSGIAALVLSKTPSLTPDQVKYRIMFTALPWIDADGNDVPYSLWQQGAGRANAYDAVFQDLMGQANQGLDVLSDLDGSMHFEGYTTFNDQTGEFTLTGEYGDLIGTRLGAWSGRLGAWSGSSQYGSWADRLGAWSGRLGAWSGGLGAWSGRLGAWSGGLGAWSGRLGAWSGGLDAWSGGYTVYADRLGAWSGRLGAWSGDWGAWSGRLGAWSGSTFIDPAFVTTFARGTAPGFSSASTSLSPWIDEPKP